MNTKIFNIICALCVACGFWACSDVDIPESASNAKGVVSSITANVPEGTRQLTLNWNNPAGDIVAVQIIKDLEDITELPGAPTSYHQGPLQRWHPVERTDHPCLYSLREEEG